MKTPVDLDRDAVVAGLIAMRKRGAIAEIFCDAQRLRVREFPGGELRYLGWQAAAESVALGRMTWIERIPCGVAPRRKPVHRVQPWAERFAEVQARRA